MSVPTEHILVLASVLFGLGVLGFLTRRNTIIVLASVELMLNAANLTFVAGSRAWSTEAGSVVGKPMHGPLFVLYVILIAPAEADIGFALIIALYRLKRTVALVALSELKG